MKDNTKTVICNTCFLKLLAAFEFKVTCIDTEDCIFPYVRLVAPVDLAEVYLKQRGNEHLTVLEDEKICRLCMQVATCGFTPVNDVTPDLIQKYIPEVVRIFFYIFSH